jgi:hypothetical protein
MPPVVTVRSQKLEEIVLTAWKLFAVTFKALLLFAVIKAVVWPSEKYHHNSFIEIYFISILLGKGAEVDPFNANSLSFNCTQLSIKLAKKSLSNFLFN